MTVDGRGGRSGEDYQALFVRQLLDRDARLKEDRRAVLNNLILLCGGGIVLSLTIFEKVGTQRQATWLLAISWLLLGSAMLAAILFLLVMTYRSLRYQSDLLNEFYRVQFEAYSDQHQFHHQGSRSSIAVPLAEIIVVALFLLGSLSLGVYAFLNVS